MISGWWRLWFKNVYCIFHKTAFRQISQFFRFIIITGGKKKYADYHSMRILGKANGKLYLKCEWAPEDYLADYGPGPISLVNDGYYTFDGEGITFISPYIYSDFDVVSENGDIIAVNQKLGKITRCPISPASY